MKAALLLATAAIASARVHVRPELSLGWRSASAEISSMVAHPDHEVSFLVSLRSQNMDVVYKFVGSALCLVHRLHVARRHRSFNASQHQRYQNCDGLACWQQHEIRARR